MAQECRYLLNPSVPPPGVCPCCLTQRLLFFQNQLKCKRQLSSLSHHPKKIKEPPNPSFSLFRKLHLPRSLPFGWSFFGQPIHGSGKNYFSSVLSSETQFSIEDSAQDSCSQDSLSGDLSGKIHLCIEESSQGSGSSDIHFSVEDSGQDSCDLTDSDYHRVSSSSNAVLGIKRDV
ncbi:hypothetical protein AMTRI_Chr07g77820 [Amborella trichopoda]|uniref:Uncharacterized protein n=1 Tax=Amborella trichopoda TaxID=13333 RepID=W1P0P0_AMBTC|nr:hypothetical protein AMTR_s00102p00053300 [Amborella trichopoda]